MEKETPTPEAVAVPMVEAPEVQTAVNSLFEQRNREIQQRKDEVQAALTQHRQDYQTLKEQMLALNGEEFVARIEEDEDFRKGKGPGFDSKFLNHRFPAIVRMANLRRQIVDEESELEQLDRSMAHLAANPAAMMMSPAELYAMIEEQKREIARLRRLLTSKVGNQEDDPWVFETVLPGHTGPVKHLEWSPDGERLVSASQDGEILLWGVDGALESSIKLLTPSGQLSRMLWSPDGGRVAIMSWNVSAKGGYCLQFFDGRTGTSLSALSSPRGVLAAYWSDENTLCVVEYHKADVTPWTQSLRAALSVFNCDGSNQQRPVQLQNSAAGGNLSCVALSPSARLIAIIYCADAGPSALDANVYDASTGQSCGAVAVRLEAPKPSQPAAGYRESSQHVWCKIPAACCYAEWSNSEQFLLLSVLASNACSFILVNLRTYHTHRVVVHGLAPADCCWHTVNGQDVLLARFSQSCWLLDPANPTQAATAVDPAMYPFSVQQTLRRRDAGTYHTSSYNLPCHLHSCDFGIAPRKATIDGPFIIVHVRESFLQSKQTFETKDGL